VEAPFAGISPLNLSSRSPATSRAGDHQRVGHPVFNLRRSLSFFAKMHEDVDRSAILRLAVHDDVKMHRMSAEGTSL
jgi:hypothetical protein